jgi:hypothetical protein
MGKSTYTNQPLVAHEAPTKSRDREGETPHPILFGAQAREHERRFAQLEQHLIREATDLRNDLKRRFDSLEVYIKKEVDGLTNRLTSEQQVRGESVTKLTQELTQLAKTLENKARQLESQAAEVQTEFLRRLAERTNELATDVRARHAEATSALDRAVQDLRAEKTDRATLATILMEASKRLSDDDARSGR